jgi:PEP-CTERM motif
VIALGAGKCLAGSMRWHASDEMLEGIVKLTSSVFFVVAVAMVAAPAQAGIFYQSISDLTVAPNIAEGSCSTCSGSGSQWTGEAFSLSSTETVRSIEFTVATATFPASVTLGFYDLGGSMTVGPQVGANFTLSTSSYVTITPGSQPTNIVTALLPGGGQTLTAGTYLLFITSSNLALPEYLGSGNGIFVDDGVLDLAPGQTYKPLGNSYDIGVALSNSVPEPSTWAMMLLGFGGLGFACHRASRRGVSKAA